jgi:hypothetical protein
MTHYIAAEKCGCRQVSFTRTSRNEKPERLETSAIFKSLEEQKVFKKLLNEEARAAWAPIL